MIAKITGAEGYRYSDSGQRIAHVQWIDNRGRPGHTSGDPDNEHMKALLSRAARECHLHIGKPLTF
jgi:hypothetical protein